MGSRLAANAYPMARGAALKPGCRQSSALGIHRMMLSRSQLTPFGALLRAYGSKNYPTHIVVKMPALSPTMTMGNIGEWKKTVGDEVNAGDVLVEIETDKAQMELEHQDDGFLAKILTDGGSKDVPVEQPIAIIVESKDDVTAFSDYKVEGGSTASKSAEPATRASAGETASPEPSASSANEATSTQSMPTSTENDGSRIKSSPVAKILMKENSVEARSVVGTGPGGRILKSDVLNYIENTKHQDAVASPATASHQAAQPAAGSAASSVATAEYDDIEITGMRRIIANRLTESKTTIPHYYLETVVEMDQVMKMRKQLNDSAGGAYKISINDFIIKASASALMQVPDVNSSWIGSAIRRFRNADISVAVATDSGLITPIIPQCNALGLASISNKMKELAAKAHDRKLLPHEFQGGSFSISNLGMFGISSFSAVINPPHAAILAVGTTTKTLVPDESAELGFRVASTMALTLSADHRVVDGAVGANFMKALKSYLENPLKLIL